ncbi:MAG: hypothetical protein HY204_03275 [Nitrospirae bacterium]|nr:hypothetical protein [Nitrospirota bacterium]
MPRPFVLIPLFIFPPRLLLDAIGAVMQLIQKFRGGTAASIARASGEIPPA